jgi:hypothetical protein
MESYLELKTHHCLETGVSNSESFRKIKLVEGEKRLIQLGKSNLPQYLFDG